MTARQPQRRQTHNSQPRPLQQRRRSASARRIVREKPETQEES